MHYENHVYVIRGENTACYLFISPGTTHDAWERFIFKWNTNKKNE